MIVKKTIPVVLGWGTFVGGLLWPAHQPGSAQQTAVLQIQETNADTPRPMTQSELQRLGDPFFNLVLRDHAEQVRLDAIVSLIQPDKAQQHLFAVSEDIQAHQNGLRRSVMSFSGSNGGQVLDANLMLSVFFDSDQFLTDIEAWGWDDQRGRYNYYRLDNNGTPNGALSWKFRGSSVDADMTSLQKRRNRCIGCHINGAPVMKELLLPWNNWHSFSAPVSHFDRSSAQAWPIVSSPMFVGTGSAGGLAGAEELEGTIIAAIRQFNRRRIDAALAQPPGSASNETATVQDGRRLLRHLFTTTEFNIASAAQLSGLHPFANGSATGPTEPVRIPPSFLLNVNLLAGGGIPEYKGLGVPSARKLEFTVQPDEYKRLVTSAKLKLAEVSPADTNFAWFVPEPSHMDNDMVDQLVKRGVITREFAAAVIAIDLENPVLSTERASLFRFVPKKWSFTPSGGHHPDDLTNQVIAALKEFNPKPNTAAHRLLSLLQSNTPLAEVQKAVDTYRTSVSTRLSDPTTRPAELSRLFGKAVALRKRIKAHPLGILDETGNRLFPLP